MPSLVAASFLALNALDRDRSTFPSAGWEVILSSSPPVFHDDVKLTTELSFFEDRGLLDLSFAFHVTDKIETTNDQGETVTTEQTIESLLNMKDLLLWLQSGKSTFGLKMVHNAAPRVDFKKNLRILEDMGADSERILVSPLCIGLLRMMNNTTALKRQLMLRPRHGWMNWQVTTNPLKSNNRIPSRRVTRLSAPRSRLAQDAPSAPSHRYSRR